MSAALTDSAPWSHRRWFWTVLLVFAGQAGLAWWLCEQGHSPASRDAPATRVRLGTDTLGEGRWGAQSATSDPTLLALANPHGFSGEAWLRMQPFPYELTNRLEEPRWLQDTPDRLAASLSRFFETNWIAAARVTEAPHPSLLPPPGTIRPMKIEASLFLEGELAGRRLISSDALPTPDPGTIPTNCVVRLAVTAEGDALSPVIWTTSGYPGIDRKAVSFAKSARFVSLEKGPDPDSRGSNFTAFGIMIFRWNLAPDPSTNPAAKPGSL